MARQLVTVLGTLIVVIAAFYFGANSVQQKWRDTEKSETVAYEEGQSGAVILANAIDQLNRGPSNPAAGS